MLPSGKFRSWASTRANRKPGTVGGALGARKRQARFKRADNQRPCCGEDVGELTR